ncbi:MAG: SGNH/GDSL hydrolase family protein, partial [Bacteroidia bacterium]|nr:SGNH/GDSL hydrolase family protein [Bacteroidia bacterium]
LKFFLSNFQIVRRLHNSINPPSLETIQWTTDFRKKTGQVTALPNMITRPKINLKAYETNLNSFIGICLRQRIKLVLVTQASTWNSKTDPEVRKLHWLTSYGNVKCSETVLDTLLEKYNNVMRNIADSSDILLYDLAKKIPKSREFFFDDCHFNNKGARFYADSLTAFIREKILTTRINQTTKN